MIQKSAILTFPSELIDRPIISDIVRKTKVEVNILQAYITPKQDGHMFIIFSGQQEAVDTALRYLADHEVGVVLPDQNLIWKQEYCVHCTACVGQCSSGAFSVNPDTFEVSYDGSKCIACRLCIPACSYGAIEGLSDNLRKSGVL
jgi:ferredoxin